MQGLNQIAKNLGMIHNVCLRVIDEPTHKVVQQHVGHNAATNTLLTGVGQFLLGGSVTGAGQLLQQWIPQYISLGTMGLGSQEEDEYGLPRDVGDTSAETEEGRMTEYLKQTPGFGSDGSADPDTALVNYRRYSGLGPMFADREEGSTDPKPTIGCELISNTFPRAKISMRQALSESRSEYPRTIDVIFSSLISTGALAQFREPDKPYLFISEVGLWSKPTWSSGNNGLLAGYRIAPPDQRNWDMTVEENRNILKRQILKVGINQAVQVIWKIQIGSIDEFGLSEYSNQIMDAFFRSDKTLQEVLDFLAQP